MMEWIIYTAKVSICSALFLAFYVLVLKRFTFFKLNRFYLVLSLLLSFTIPVLQVNVTRVAAPVSVESRPYSQETDRLASIRTGFDVLVNDTNGIAKVDWLALTPVVYLLIATLLLLIFVYRLVQLLKYASGYTETVNGLRLVDKEKGFTNCSFFNYVFIHKSALSETDIKVLLQHEGIHARQYHSVDKVILALCKVVLWFNPAIYLFDKALEQVHEYEADEATSSASGSQHYANLLLTLAAVDNGISFVHNFVKHPVKERINMLFTPKSKKMKKLIYLLSVPMVLGMVWIFGVDVVYAETNANRQKIEDTDVQDTLRLVGYDMPADDPKVTIDGKAYDASILTRISPRCVQSKSTGLTSIDITTVNHKIEYATETDKENVRTQIAAEKSDKFYIRYALKRENGDFYDVARVKTKESSASVSVGQGAKVLILIDGKKYSEEEAEKLTEEMTSSFKTISAGSGGSTDIRELLSKYGNEYEAAIQVSSNRREK